MESGFHIFIIAVASFCVGASKGGLPAISLLAVPLMGLFMPVPLAAGLLLPIYLISDAYGIVLYRRLYSAINLKLLLPFAIIGIVIGYFSVSVMSVAQSKLLVGVVGLGYLFLELIGLSTAPKTPNVKFAGVWGTLTGLTSYISHAGGPPFQAYILPQKLPKLTYAGTSTIAFAIINFIKLPFFMAAGQISMKIGWPFFMSMSAAIFGVWAGYQLTKRINEKLFYILVKAALLLISIKLIWDGVV